MKIMTVTFAVAAMLVVAATAAAQSREADQSQPAAEQRRAELQEAEAREQMLEAERQLAEAARQIAELSSQNLPRIIDLEKGGYELWGKPRMGVTIGKSDGDGPVEGVAILGVTPGSAADDAGLRAGDVITAVNDESLGADTAEQANSRLLDFMKGVEEGDKLTVEYLRDGNVGKVEVEPRVVEGHGFAWFGDGQNLTMPGVPVPPGNFRKFAHVAPFYGNAWGDMELVELSKGLGRYFGTDQGLLVVSAPKSDAFRLQDGDVIQSIDGREPTSVGHAMRILSSYQPGESIKLGIMRDKQHQTLSIEMPDNRTGFVPPPPAPRPASFVGDSRAALVDRRS